MLSRTNAIVLIAVAACAPPAAVPTAAPRLPGQTTFEVSGEKTPPIENDFTPPPQLADPLPGDPRVFGATYLELVGAAVSPRWSTFVNELRVRLPPHHPLNDATLATRVSFVVRGNGSLADVLVVRSSESPAYDDVVLEVLLESAPFPSPPPEVQGDDGVVRLSWLFARDVRQAGVATAAVRPVVWPAERAVPALLARGEPSRAAARVAADQSATAELADHLVDKIAAHVVRAAAADGDARAIAALEDADAQEILPALESLAAAVGSPSRVPALAALARLRAPSVADGAREAISSLETPDDIVVALATAWAALGQAAIREISAGVSELLASGEPARRRRAFVIASAVPLPGVAKPAMTLSGEAEAIELAAPALARLAAVGHRSVTRTIIRNLTAKEAERRAAFARSLAGTGTVLPSIWRSHLERRLGDADERVRAAALEAIASSWPRRLGYLAAKFRRETSPLVLVSLASSLAGDRSRRSTKALVGLLAHREAAVRAAAARSLWGRKQAAAALAPLRLDPDDRVAQASLPSFSLEELRELALTGDSRAAAALTAHLSMVIDGRFVAGVLAAADSALRLEASLSWLAARKRATLRG